MIKLLKKFFYLILFLLGIVLFLITFLMIAILFSNSPQDVSALMESDVLENFKKNGVPQIVEERCDYDNQIKNEGEDNILACLDGIIRISMFTRLAQEVSIIIAPFTGLFAVVFTYFGIRVFKR